MKQHIFPLTVFTVISIYFISCIYFYGISNISIYNILLFLFASPLLEEYIFRGLVQKRINKIVKTSFFLHISLGCFISSFIFAFIHFLAGGYNYVNFLVFFPSLFLGYMYDKYNTLKLPVLFHSFFNINVFIAYPLNYLTVMFVEKI